MANLINNIIKINRGDTYDLDITITGENGGFYKLTGQDKLYFALMEAGDEFEDAILYKIATADTTPVEYDDDGVHVIEYHFVIESNDTAHLLPDTYYYTVKLELDHNVVINNVETNEHVSGVYTIINRTKFIIMGATERYGAGRQQHAMTLVDQTFDENGTYLAGAYGADGFRQVIVALPLVPEETFTENGTYTAPEGGGFEQVTVNVQPTENLDAVLDSENQVVLSTVENDHYYATLTVSLNQSLSDSILEGVSILGVVGTHRDAVIYTGNIDSITTNVHDESLLNTVNGNYSSVFGADNISDGNYNLIGGGGNVVYGDRNYVLGTNNIIGVTSEDTSSTCIFGDGNIIGSQSTRSIILGYDNRIDSTPEAKQRHVYILGEYLTTSNENQVLLGKYNASASDARLILGNGTNENNRHNLLTIYDSSVQCGQNNVIGTNPKYVFVFGGAQASDSGNQVGDNAEYINVFGGSSNVIDSNTTDCTIFGYQNRVFGGPSSSSKKGDVYLFGHHLQANNAKAVFGRYNIDDSNAIFEVGYGSRVNNVTTRKSPFIITKTGSVLCGDSNIVDATNIYNNVFGDSNTIGANGLNNFITGHGITVGSSLTYSIISGRNQIVGNDADYINIFGGSTNKIGENNAGISDCTVFGYDNTIYGGTYTSAGETKKNDNVYIMGHDNTNNSDSYKHNVYLFGNNLLPMENGQFIVGEWNGNSTSSSSSRYSPPNTYFLVGTGESTGRRTSFAVGYNGSLKAHIYIGKTYLTEAELQALKALIS